MIGGAVCRNVANMYYVILHRCAIFYTNSHVYRKTPLSANKPQSLKLFPLVKRALTVPASSALVERVLSQGGLIMRPHLLRLS